MRFTSRKFLVTLAMILVSVAVIYHPDKTDWVERMVTKVAGVLAAYLAVVKYVDTEGQVDLARSDPLVIPPGSLVLTKDVQPAPPNTGGTGK